MLSAWWLASLLAAAQPAVVSGDQVPLGPIAWADGGRRLAFVASSASEPAWYVTDLADGAQPAEVRWDPRPESAFRVWWHPDGSRVAYPARRDGQRVMLIGGIDGEEPMTFAVIGNVNPVEAAWSPDGRMLAFGLRAEQGAAQPYELFYCEANGAHGAHVPLDAAPVGLAWSRNAKRLAFCTQSLGRTILFTCDLDQSIARSVSAHLTVTPGSVAWSTDNLSLAFNGALDPTKGRRLFVSRAVGQMAADRVERPGYVADAPAVYSDDGQWLAWTVGPQGEPSPAPLVLGRVRAPSLAARVSPGNAAEPAFSPDSEWLAFTAFDSTTPRRTRVVALRPSQPDQLATVDAGPNASHPVFSPTGDKLAWLSGSAEKPCVKVVAWPPN